MTRGKMLVLALAMGLAASGCGGEESGLLETCVKDQLAIKSGIYGQIFNGCDTPGCRTMLAVGTEVRVYDRDPTTDGTTEGYKVTPLAKPLSDAAGVYQVELAPGRYYLCVYKCTMVDLEPSSPLARHDYASGLGGGNWWQGAECVQP